MIIQRLSEARNPALIEISKKIEVGCLGGIEIMLDYEFPQYLNFEVPFFPANYIHQIYKYKSSYFVLTVPWNMEHLLLRIFLVKSVLGDLVSFDIPI